MRSYIDLFMAPVFTEEEMSNEEYKNLKNEGLLDENTFYVILENGVT